MATKANAAKVTATAVTPDAALMAQFAAFMAAQQTAAKPVAAKPVADPATAVVAAITAAGGKVIRTGKSGMTPKGKPKAWVDATFGGVRVQGNVFLTGK